MISVGASETIDNNPAMLSFLRLIIHDLQWPFPDYRDLVRERIYTQILLKDFTRIKSISRSNFMIRPGVLSIYTEIDDHGAKYGISGRLSEIHDTAKESLFHLYVGFSHSIQLISPTLCVLMKHPALWVGHNERSVRDLGTIKSP